jgi:hypothetical protein
MRIHWTRRFQWTYPRVLYITTYQILCFHITFVVHCVYISHVYIIKWLTQNAEPQLDFLFTVKPCIPAALSLRVGRKENDSLSWQRNARDRHTEFLRENSVLCSLHFERDWSLSYTTLMDIRLLDRGYGVFSSHSSWTMEYEIEVCQDYFRLQACLCQISIHNPCLILTIYRVRTAS